MLPAGLVWKAHTNQEGLYSSCHIRLTFLGNMSTEICTTTITGGSRKRVEEKHEDGMAQGLAGRIFALVTRRSSGSLSWLCSDASNTLESMALRNGWIPGVPVCLPAAYRSSRVAGNECAFILLPFGLVCNLVGALFRISGF